MVDGDADRVRLVPGLLGRRRHLRHLRLLVRADHLHPLPDGGALRLPPHPQVGVRAEQLKLREYLLLYSISVLQQCSSSAAEQRYNISALKQYRSAEAQQQV